MYNFLLVALSQNATCIVTYKKSSHFFVFFLGGEGGEGGGINWKHVNAMLTTNDTVKNKSDSTLNNRISL